MVDLRSFTNNWCRHIEKCICANCLVRPNNDCYMDVEPLHHHDCRIMFQLQQLFDLDFRMAEIEDEFSKFEDNEDDPRAIALNEEYADCDSKSCELFMNIFNDSQQYEEPEPPAGWENWQAHYSY